MSTFISATIVIATCARQHAAHAWRKGALHRQRPGAATDRRDDLYETPEFMVTLNVQP
jgi:hypothetical protein